MRKIIFWSLIFSSSLWATEPKESKPYDSNKAIYEEFQKLKQKLFDDIYTGKEDQKTDSLMDDFLSNSRGLMKDIDENLFKSFGFGANLTSDLFQARWQEEKNGKSFLITPKKNAELKIEVKNGFITISSTEKTKNAQSTSVTSMSVPQYLDCNKYKYEPMKGKDIVIFFPYSGNMPQNLKKEDLTPSKSDSDKKNSEDDTEPVIPKGNYDVI